MTTQHITLNQTLTPHFTLAEFVRSGVAIRHNIANTPTPNAINNLRLLCENVLEPLRRRFGVIRITSGYRCEELNNMVGGKPNSQHLLGQAADIHLSNKEVAMSSTSLPNVLTTTSCCLSIEKAMGQIGYTYRITPQAIAKSNLNWTFRH